MDVGVQGVRSGSARVLPALLVGAFACVACTPDIDLGRLDGGGGSDGDVEAAGDAPDDADDAGETPATCGNGTVDTGEACDTSGVTLCRTVCGSTGVAECLGCTAIGPCAVPSEQCNGSDDDCDGHTDEGFECAAGGAVACTTACGLEGTGRCDEECRPPVANGCVAAEACNGCDDDGNGSTDERCPCAGGWAREHPVVEEGDVLSAVAAASGPPQGFAVGAGGRVLRFDGTRWLRGDSGAATGWRDVAVLGPTAAVAVGTRGSIRWWNGAEWNVQSSGTTWELRGVCARSADDVWAVGVHGTILHFDGRAWSTVSPGPTPNDLADCRIAGPSRVYAVGAGGTVVRFNGVEWSSLPSYRTVELTAAWSAGPDDLYVVGTAGSILRWTEVAGWSDLSVGIGLTFNGIWGSGPRDIWVIGAAASEVMYHSGDGTTWTARGDFPTIGGSGLVSIDGTAADDVFVLGRGGGVLHYDGTGWEPMEGAATVAFTSIVGRSGHAVHALGGGRGVLDHDGLRWTLSSWLDDAVLEGLWVSPAGDLFGVGAGATAVRFDGATWEPVVEGLPGIDLRAAWGAATDRLWAVGRTIGGGSSAAVVRYDGARWSVPATERPLPAADLRAVAGSTAGETWAVGTGGTIVRCPPDAPCAVVEAGVTGALRGVWSSETGQAYAVGDGGAILRYDGETWSSMTSPTARTLRAVWGASAADVFAAGDGATLLRYDGDDWVPIDLGGLTTRNLTGIWGSATNNVFVVADDAGTILHRCGPAW